MEACQNIRNEDGERVAHYTNEQVNTTHMRGAGRQGWCIPIECKTESVDYFNDVWYGYMNNQLAMLPSYGINFNTLIFNTESRVGSIFTIPEEYNPLQA